MQLPNIVEFILSHLAIASRGAVMQTLRMPYHAAELHTLLAHGGATAAIVVSQGKDWSAAGALLEMKPRLPALRQVIAVDAGTPASGPVRKRIRN